MADFQPVGDTLTIITPLGADAALTSQTLRADGTPKCPMNAFMIFARVRRSQPSAANHSMRTGECKTIEIVGAVVEKTHISVLPEHVFMLYIDN